MVLKEDHTLVELHSRQLPIGKISSRGCRVLFITRPESEGNFLPLPPWDVQFGGLPRQPTLGRSAIIWPSL